MTDLQHQHDALRQTLDKLHYPEYFSMDSIDLIKRLISDLIQTSESCKKLKNQNDQLKLSKEKAIHELKPLQNDIHTLTSENNQLHRDLIRYADERTSREAVIKETLRRYEDEISDLRFLNTQYCNQIRLEQQKWESERNKVEEFLKRQQAYATSLNQGKGVTKTSAKSDKFLNRIPTIEVETGLEPMKEDALIKNTFPIPDIHLIDMQKLGEARIEGLELELRDAKNQITDLENEIQHMREQVSTREDEIHRLGGLLEMKRSELTELTFESHNRSFNTSHQYQMEKQLDYFHDKVESLQQSIQKLEGDKKTLLNINKKDKEKMSTEIASLRTKNERIERLLREKEQETNERSFSRTSSPTKSQKSVSISVDKENELGLKNENSLLESHEPQEVSIKEYKGLCKRHSLLKLNHRKVVTELEELKIAMSKLRIDYERLQTSKMFRTIGLTSESEKTTKMNYDNAQQTVPTNLKENITQTEQIKSSNNLETAENLTENLYRLDDLSKHYEMLQSQASILESKSAKLEKTLGISESLISNLRAENSILRKETESLKNNNENLQASKEKFIHELDGLKKNISILQNDRKQLEQETSKMISSLRSELEVVKEEKENIKELYAQLRPKSSYSISTSPQKIAVSNAETQVELPQNDKEIQSLNERLNELHKDKQELKDNLQKVNKDLEETKKNLKSVEESKQELQRELQKKKSKLMELQEEGQDTESINVQLKKELSEKDNRLSYYQEHVKVLQSELETQKHELKSLRSKENLNESELRECRAQINRLAKEIDQHMSTIKRHKQLLIEVDRERDIFQSELDNKAEKLAEFDSIIENMKENNDFLSHQNMELQENNDILGNTLNEQDKELGNVQKEVAELLADREKLYVDNQALMENVNHLSSDLNSVSTENQRLNEAVAKLSSEKDKLLIEIRSIEKQMCFLENSMKEKEQEKDHIMHAYRKLIREHERLEASHKFVTEDINKMRTELLIKDQNSQHLQKIIDDFSVQVQQLSVDVEAYDKQCTELTAALSDAEKEIRRLEMDRDGLQREMGVARDFTTSIDRSREDLQQHITKLSIELEKMDRERRKLESDKEKLYNHLKEEEAKSLQLENLLVTERTKQYKSALVQKELVSSKESTEDSLQAKNDLLCKEIESYNKNMNALQEECMTLKNRIGYLERQLNGKEKALQEALVKVAELEERLQHRHSTATPVIKKDRNTSFSSASSSSSSLSSKSSLYPSPLERKIMYEIERTKDQIKDYEKRLSKNITEQTKHSPSTISASSSETPRNSSGSNVSGENSRSHLATSTPTTERVSKMTSLQVSPLNEGSASLPDNSKLIESIVQVQETL